DEAAQALAYSGSPAERLPELLKQLDRGGIRIVEEDSKAERGRHTHQRRRLRAAAAEPVQTYLDWMGSVTLLTREGEVELARAIERGRSVIYNELVDSGLGGSKLAEVVARVEGGELPRQEAVLEPAFTELMERLEDARRRVRADRA